MARASFGKMTVWIIQLQGKGSRLNGSAFLLPLSRIPTLCPGSAGQLLLPALSKLGLGQA